ncbi:MAG: protein translocase subunit SecD [Lachnospiraceae bacterium]|nr:protein translocase subunit SecD [Lachnospiraceae bacterium]
MKGKGFIKLLATLVVIAILGVVVIVGVNKDHAMSARDVKLGLDLAGGVSITYETVKEDPTADELSDTVYKMQRRAEAFSTEAQVYPEGDRRITVAIPDITDADEVLKQLGDAGNIYFVYGMSSKGVANIAYSQDPVSLATSTTLARSLDEIIADGDVVIDGTHITGASADIITNQLGMTENIVRLNLNDEGRTRFASATSYCYGYYGSNSLNNIIAIVYDNEVISAPQVAAVISDGVATISGQRDYDEANILASTIRIGALPLELSVLRYYVESAKLGLDALTTSLIAGLIGFVLIIIFMIAFYRIPGVASALALLFYIELMIICLNVFNVTLTLPGIAGIILSVGMAVDANVIIFTRIREEIGTGKTVRSAIKVGFHKALSAIVDGNVTTIIAAIVLFALGSGTVVGFAQTLAIGVVLSMLTALIVTKFVLGGLFEAGCTKVGLYGTKVEKPAKPFVKHFPKFICISAVCIIVGIVGIFINFGKYDAPFNYGLDFAGGTATSITFDDGIPADAQSTLEKLVLDTVKEKAELSTVESENMITVKTKELSTENRALLTQAIIDKFGVSDENLSTTSVGSTVSGEMKRDAIVAVIVATICMLIYIWIRFRNINFALAAVVALIHDVLVVISLYAIDSAGITVGSTFIACLLTIVGYSINATIVIFDRIRENIAENHNRYTYAEIVNRSITQTFSRSINTSLTTFIAVFFLAVMGATSVREFAIPLIVGIVAGTFSSICLTGGLWYTLQKKLKKEV